MREDARIAARVRAAIGNAVSDAGAIEVTAYHGQVTLSGPVLRSEADALIGAACRARGVLGVENALDIREAPGNAPRGSPAKGQPSNSARRAPARAAAGALWMAVGWLALRRFGLPGLPLAVASAAFAARTLPGRGAFRRKIEIFRTVRIDAPADSVHGFWSRFEDLPRFLRHVSRISGTGAENEWRWTVGKRDGPSVSWNAWVTESIPGKLLAWESAPDSPLFSAGIVDIGDNGDGTTDLAVRLSYRWGAPGLGDAVSRSFGLRPGRQLSRDLARMKTYLETGALRVNPPAGPASRRGDPDGTENRPEDAHRSTGAAPST